MANRRGKGASRDRFPLLGLQNHCGWWLQPWNQKMIASWQETDGKPRQCVEKQKHYYSANKGPYSQSYGLPSGHVWLWELDHKEGRMWNNLRLSTMLLEKTPESPLTARRSNQSVLSKINPEYSLNCLMLKLKFQYFGHLMQTDDSLEKSCCWERSGQKEKRTWGDEMAGWHHQCNEHELRQALGMGEGQAGLPCCNPWGHREVGTTG